MRVWRPDSRSPATMSRIKSEGAAGAAGGPETPPSDGDGTGGAAPADHKDDVIDAEYTEGPETKT